MEVEKWWTSIFCPPRYRYHRVWEILPSTKIRWVKICRPNTICPALLRAGLRHITHKHWCHMHCPNTHRILGRKTLDSLPDMSRIQKCYCLLFFKVGLTRILEVLAVRSPPLNPRIVSLACARWLITPRKKTQANSSILMVQFCHGETNWVWSLSDLCALFICENKWCFQFIEVCTVHLRVPGMEFSQ